MSVELRLIGPREEVEAISAELAGYLGERLVIKRSRLGRYNEWLVYGNVERAGAPPTGSPALQPWKVRKVGEPGAGGANSRQPGQGRGKGSQEEGEEE